MGCIEQRTETHADNIGRNNRVFVVAEALGSRRFHRRVDAVNSHIRTLDNCGQDGGRTGRNGHALCRTDEFAVELGDNQTDCFCSTGGVGNDVCSACTCTAKVAFSVWTVQNHLVAGVSVNGAHDTALDRCIVVQGFRHGRQAVGGAGCSRNNLVIRSQGFFVYAVNDGLKVVACGRGNNNFLSPCGDVCLCLVFGAVEACALKHNVYADFAPGKLSCVCNCINFQGFAVYSDGACFIVRGNRVCAFADFAAVTALCGVILQKMCQHGGLGKVVDCDDIIAFCAEHLSECETADTAETIDCNFNCHWDYLQK